MHASNDQTKIDQQTVLYRPTSSEILYVRVLACACLHVAACSDRFFYLLLFCLEPYAGPLTYIVLQSMANVSRGQQQD